MAFLGLYITVLSVRALIPSTVDTVSSNCIGVGTATAVPIGGTLHKISMSGVIVIAVDFPTPWMKPHS